MPPPKADLVTLCNGAALELLQSALAQVNQNIKDPNTSTTKNSRWSTVFGVRQILLTATILEGLSKLWRLRTV